VAGGGESASLGSECGGVVTALCDDPAGVIVDEFTTALRQGFDPASVCPPVGGGSVVVRFLAGPDSAGVNGQCLVVDGGWSQVREV